MAEYEQRTITLPKHLSPRAARELLGIHAEYGDWELLRHAIYDGGVRKVTLRRRLRPGLPPLTT